LNELMFYFDCNYFQLLPYMSALTQVLANDNIGVLLYCFFISGGLWKQTPELI